VDRFKLKYYLYFIILFTILIINQNVIINTFVEKLIIFSSFIFINLIIDKIILIVYLIINIFNVFAVI